MTDIPLIGLVQQRIPNPHLAKAFGMWEAGIAGGAAVVPLIAALAIARLGVRTGFMLSGAMLIALSLVGVTALVRVGGLKPEIGVDHARPPAPTPARRDDASGGSPTRPATPATVRGTSPTHPRREP